MPVFIKLWKIFSINFYMMTSDVLNWYMTLIDLEKKEMGLNIGNLWHCIHTAVMHVYYMKDMIYL